MFFLPGSSSAHSVSIVSSFPPLFSSYRRVLAIRILSCDIRFSLMMSSLLSLLLLSDLSDSSSCSFVLSLLVSVNLFHSSRCCCRAVLLSLLHCSVCSGVQTESYVPAQLVRNSALSISVCGYFDASSLYFALSRALLTSSDCRSAIAQSSSG